MRVLAITMTLVALLGCAKPWHRPGATQMEFQRDKGECMAQARSMSFDQSFAGSFAAVSVWYPPCMEGRGWSQ